jgi:HEAT repeat protein
MSEEEILKTIKLLENENPALRQSALEQLSKHKENHIAINAILKALHDKDKDVRSHAVDILGHIHEREVLIALSQTLDDEAWEVRKSTITSFGKMKEPDTVPFLIAALNDNHPQVRFTAAKELKNFDSSSMIEPLFETLKDETESVREEARSTLMNFKTEVPASIVAGFLLDTNKFVREVVVEFLISRVLGNPIPHLEKACYDKEWEIRYLALKEMSKIFEKIDTKDPKVIEINLESLKDENSKVRYQAISNLGAINAIEAIEPLGDIARNDPDHNNRLMATETMTSIRRAQRME